MDNHEEVLDDFDYICDNCQTLFDDDENLRDIETGVNPDKMYCKPCVELSIKRGEVEVSKCCEEYFEAGEPWEWKNGKQYCGRCFDEIDTESEEE